MSLRQTENSHGVKSGNSSYFLLCYNELWTVHGSSFMLLLLGRSYVPLTHEARCAFPELEMLHISKKHFFVLIFERKAPFCGVPTPPHSWYEATYFKNVLLMNTRQKRHSRKHLEGKK